jgi:magnesium chelatase subunit I
VETGSDVSSDAYTGKLPQMANMKEMVERIEDSDDPSAIASAIEFILEGLHLNRRLNCDRIGGQYIYSG